MDKTRFLYRTESLEFERIPWGIRQDAQLLSFFRLVACIRRLLPTMLSAPC
jgi:hypothetical protein